MLPLRIGSRGRLTAVTSSLASRAVAVVAVKAERMVNREALSWAVTHVVRPGDCIVLLFFFSGKPSGRRLWSLPFWSGNCTSNIAGHSLPEKICEISRGQESEHGYTLTYQDMDYGGRLVSCCSYTIKEWLNRAINWAKFSATIELGVIHKGHLQQDMSLMAYLTIRELLVDEKNGNPFHGDDNATCSHAENGHSEMDSIFPEKAVEELLQHLVQGMDEHLIEFSEAMRIVAKALKRVAEGKASAQTEAGEWKRKFKLAAGA